MCMDDLQLYRAVRDATVRSGCELSTPKIDLIEINTVVEALEVKKERGGMKRIRCAEGWVSSLTQKVCNFFINNYELCINNDELCINNDELCIKNDGFCIKNAEFRKGAPLMQCLGEARLEREADAVRREEMIVEQVSAAPF